VADEPTPGPHVLPAGARAVPSPAPPDDDARASRVAGRGGDPAGLPPAAGAADAVGRAGSSSQVEPPDAVFVALADPTRRAILRAVADGGPVTATALAGDLPVSRQAGAKHHGLLRRAGLVVAERAGRETRFTVVAAPLDGLAVWAAAAGRRWDDRLARLRRHLD
jgi:DNA-binding transcriptional ArsR family regulator